MALTTSLPLPPQFRASNPQPQLLAQGAEALVYRTHFLNPSRPCILKYRPPKKWRHPTLDTRLTRHRILAEARILVRCQREGVRVPAVLALDWEGSVEGEWGTNMTSKKVASLAEPPTSGISSSVASTTEASTCTTSTDSKPTSSVPERTGGWMMVEWISGGTVRAALEKWTASVKGTTSTEMSESWVEELLGLMRQVGEAVGRLHSVGLVHGDLTTSNLMLQREGDEGNAAASQTAPSLKGEIVLIDFGLAAQVSQEEERAVDLYVLERAFGSTHPSIEEYFSEVLIAYGQSYKGAKLVLRRLEDVRQRGRKKSMIG